MKTLKEQIENKCNHFTGMSNKECKVGIKYEDVKDKEARPLQIPCLKDSTFSGGGCEKVCFPTPKEVESKVKEIEDIGLSTTNAYSAVDSHIKKTGQKQGKIKCPSCDGDLRYSQAEVNGHIWAKCTCGLGWME